MVLLSTTTTVTSMRLMNPGCLPRIVTLLLDWVRSRTNMKICFMDARPKNCQESGPQNALLGAPSAPTRASAEPIL